MLSDRTTTIRASVEDVQFTLMLTIGLVVMVIFVFLRSFWATIIPSITVPLALLGACALMWAVGYSLDNLSLMALTIAVGFVVDDAIVMLENITRHIEEGMKPFAAALKGAGEIGFTIISISVSLVAVLIPLLADERHHRPPVPRIRGHDRDDDRRLGDRVADADADDGLALPQEPRRGAARPALQAQRAGLRRRWRNGYERGLDFVLRHQLRDAADLPRHRRRDRLSVRRSSPRASSRSRTPASCSAPPKPAQDVSFPEMYELQEQLGAIVQADPAVATIAMGLGTGVGNAAQNNGRMFITLKPREERDVDAFQVIARLRPKLAEVKGVKALSASGAGRDGRRARRAHAVPVHDPGRQSRRAERLVAENSRQAASRCRNCATSPPTSRSPARRCS